MAGLCRQPGSHVTVGWRQGQFWGPHLPSVLLLGLSSSALMLPWAGKKAFHPLIQKKCCSYNALPVNEGPWQTLVNHLHALQAPSHYDSYSLHSDIQLLHIWDPS